VLDLAGDTLGGFHDQTARQLVQQVGNRAHRDVRYVCARALGHFGLPEDLERVVGHLRDRDAEVRRAAAGSLVRAREAAIPVLGAALERYEKEPDWRVKALLIEAFGRCHYTPARPSLEAAAATINLPVACTALTWLGGFDGAFDLLRDHVTDKRYPKGVAAVRGIVRTEQKDVIPILIDRLRGVHRRVQGEILYVLEKLTGKQIGLYPRVWAAWWEENRINFIPDWEAAYRDPADEPDGLWKDPPSDLAQEEGANATVTFFGLELYTKNVVFILDTSKSMGGMSFSKELRRRDGSPETRPYIDRVKEELQRTIRNLPPDVRFNVYFFDEDVRKIFYKMELARPQKKEKALGVTRRQTAQGAATDAYKAFEEVWDEDGEIDTIVFLSDGVPTKGKVTDPYLFLEWVKEKNRGHCACIHTISVGYRDEILGTLMRGLAASSGGRYVHR
jgi:hypothetical protein